MCNYNTELLDFVWPGLFVRCRAGAPGCGRTRTSSGPRTAPPRGCPGWSAAGPASLASHARAPAARRSTPSLKHQTGQWKSLRSLLACWRISAKVFPWRRNMQKIAAAEAASWFQPDLSNKGAFRPYLFRGCNRRSPPPRGAAAIGVVLPKACSLPEWKSLRRFRRPPSISLTSETSVRKECCRGDDCTTLLGPAGWGALGFSLWGLGKRQETLLGCGFLD